MKKNMWNYYKAKQKSNIKNKNKVNQKFCDMKE